MPQGQASKQSAIEPLEPKAAMVEMVQVVENKKRNLEKRKQKLEALQAKPAGELTEQQKEATSHYGEVLGNIQYIEEILTRFSEVQAQVDKWCAIEAKKEKLANKRNKQNAASTNTNGAAPQPVGNGHDASAGATPRSRGSVCETAATEQVAAAQPAPTSNARDPTGDLIAPLANVAIAKTSQGDEQLQHESSPREDCAPIEDDAVPKETVTFVNSAAEGAATQGFNGMQPGRGSGRRPRRGNRPQYYDGPPRGDGYGPRYGGPPRRGGPYRGGPRGGPHAPAGARPPASAPAGDAN